MLFLKHLNDLHPTAYNKLTAWIQLTALESWSREEYTNKILIIISRHTLCILIVFHFHFHKEYINLKCERRSLLSLETNKPNHYSCKLVSRNHANARRKPGYYNLNRLLTNKWYYFFASTEIIKSQSGESPGNGWP